MPIVDAARALCHPNSVSDEHDYLKIDRADDGARNAATRLPDDERIQIRSIWICEVYTPDESARLLDAVVSLGWNSQREPFSTPLAEWLKSARRSALPGAWFPLNTIGKVSTPFGSSFAAELPDEFDSAVGAFCQTLASVTVLTLQFILRDSRRSDPVPVAAVQMPRPGVRVIRRSADPDPQRLQQHGRRALLLPLSSSPPVLLFQKCGLYAL